jgi:hypothetical protein
MNGTAKIETGPRMGTCEMCGGRDRLLCMMFIGDFAGYACAECISQVQQSMQRRYTGTAEHSEPAE